jgi:hypothetical protein
MLAHRAGHATLPASRLFKSGVERRDGGALRYCGARLQAE